MMSNLPPVPPIKKKDNYWPTALAGYIVIFVTFGVVGGWAAIAPLDSAAVGTGVIAAESNRKTIQHFEGGIVSDVLVREGEQVKTGQVLFRLDPTQARASLDIARIQLVAHLAQEARLVAERDSSDAISFPALMNQLGAPQDLIDRNIADQRKQFLERRNSINNQVGLLRARIEQLRNEIVGLDRERSGKEKQIAFLDDEIGGLRELFDKGLTQKGRLLALERERSALEGQVGRNMADRAKAENAIGESELQILQVQQKFFEEVVKEIVDTRNKIADVRERFGVSRDVLRRLEIVSPIGGTVQNLRVYTQGGVIRSGEPLIDIVPSEDRLIIRAHFSPLHANNVRPGLKAELRFPSFPSRTIPIVLGEVTSISRDRMVDDATKEPYFLALVEAPEANLPDQLRGHLTAGMPADVVVPTGERTVFGYLLDPLTNTVRKTMREQ